jgi:PadR family transcriptional regulator, regulatory protein PadR
MSLAAGLVLDALSRGSKYGFDIIDATGLASGTVYPILRRLEDDGCVKSRWESAKVAQQDQRPPRRYYALTPAGEALLAEVRSRFPILAPGSARLRRV